MASLAGSITAAISVLFDQPKQFIDFLATTLPPQATFFIQLILISTVFGLGLEVLRTTAIVQAWLRKRVGPNLTEKERNKTWMGLRPFADPRGFLHARVSASTMLFFMVAFVYMTLSPITSYFLAFCFLAMGAGYRHQFIYIYPNLNDSGGRLWMAFVTTALICMFIAELTITGFLLLKKAPVASPLMIPLLVVSLLFVVYIHQRHFRVALHLPSEDCLCYDEDGLLELDAVKGKYVQPALQDKELLPAEDDVLLGEQEVTTDGGP